MLTLSSVTLLMVPIERPKDESSKSIRLRKRCVDSLAWIICGFYGEKKRGCFKRYTRTGLASIATRICGVNPNKPELPSGNSGLLGFTPQIRVAIDAKPVRVYLLKHP